MIELHIALHVMSAARCGACQSQHQPVAQPGTLVAQDTGKETAYFPIGNKRNISSQKLGASLAPYYIITAVPLHRQLYD